MALPQSKKKPGRRLLPGRKFGQSVKDAQGRFMSQLVGVLAM